MNLSTKCNCCIKEDVCSLKDEYQNTVEIIKQYGNENIELSLKCKKFSSKEKVKK